MFETRGREGWSRVRGECERQNERTKRTPPEKERIGGLKLLEVQ